MTVTTGRKWYREPYVWMLISFPLAAVIGGIITITLAIKSDDGLVVDDYYKEGLKINRTLERDNAAKAYDLQAKLQLPENAGEFRLILSGNGDFSPPKELSVKFLHATRGGHDQEIAMKKSMGNTYLGQIPKLISGKWHILIEADDWRLVEHTFIHP